MKNKQVAIMGMPRLVVLLLLPGPLFVCYSIGYLITRNDFRLESIGIMILAAAYTGWSYRFAVRIAARLDEHMQKYYTIMVRTAQIIAPIAGIVLAVLLF